MKETIKIDAFMEMKCILKYYQSKTQLTTKYQMAWTRKLDVKLSIYCHGKKIKKDKSSVKLNLLAPIRLTIWSQSTRESSASMLNFQKLVETI